MNSGSDYLGEAVVTAAVLPARSVYLIAPNSTSGMLRAIEEASTRWGGVTEPIVVVTARDRVSKADALLVSTLRPDAAVNVDVPNELATSAAAQLNLTLVDIKFVDRGGPAMWSCFPTAVITPTSANSTPVQSDDSLWQATAIGRLTPEAVAAYENNGAGLMRPFSDDWAGRSQLTGSTVLDLGRSQFGEHWASPPTTEVPFVVHVAPADGFDDCRHFWNLRASRSLVLSSQPMILLPERGVEHWVGFADQLAGMLARAIETDADVVIQSLRVSKARLARLAESLGLVPMQSNIISVRTSWPPLPRRTAPFTYAVNANIGAAFSFQRKYGTLGSVRTQLFRTSTAVDLPSPVRFHQYLGLTLLRLTGPPFDSYPRRNEVAERILPAADWYEDALQIRTHTQDDYRLTIQLPTLREVLDLVLARKGITFAMSDKGALADAVIRRVEPSLLLEPRIRAIVMALTTPRSKALLAAVERARRTADKAHVDLLREVGERLERRHRTLTQLGSDVKGVHPAELERLVGLGWAERGLGLKCTRCEITSFVPLQLTDSPGSCPACGHHQGYRLNSKGIELTYRLNSIIDRASDQGALPHVMLVARLLDEDSDAELIPGAKLKMANGDDGEADVLGIQRRRIVLAEVKSSPQQFTRAEVQKDIRRAAATGADVQIMGCLHPIPDATVTYARRLADRAGLELIVVDDLEPTNA